MSKFTGKISMISAAVFFVFATATAQAEPAKHDAKNDDGHHGGMHRNMADQMMKEVDADANGEISKAEFEAFHAAHFKTLDSNSDGKLTKDEMAAQRDKMREKSRANFGERFKESDTNKDGSLSRDEAKAMPILSKYFDEIDSNKNGLITSEEVRVTMEKMHGGEKKRGGDKAK